jgi:predicted nucleic acid-binding protein
MDIVLVDTSVWINFFKARETASSSFLKDNLSSIIIATCPVIVQEVLQGIVANKDFYNTMTFFNSLLKFNNDSYGLALEAADMYRQLRTKGVTVRKPNDCLIACYAIKNNVKLLHDDKDFTYIAQNTNLAIQ